MLNASLLWVVFFNFQWFFEDFVMFANLGTSEIAFITIHDMDYEVSAAIFMEF